MLRPIVYLALLTFSWIFQSCSHEPEPINYNEDNCAICQMTITDKKFGSELITSKGKIIKFDSIECLAKYLNEEALYEENGNSAWVTDYTTPTSLIKAKDAIFLRSHKIRSPMGEFLSAYRTHDEASKMVSSSEDSLYRFSDIRKILK